MTYYLIKKLHHWKDFRGQVGLFNASVGNPDGNKNYTSFLPVFDDYNAALKYVDGEEKWIETIETAEPQTYNRPIPRSLNSLLRHKKSKNKTKLG